MISDEEKIERVIQALERLGISHRLARHDPAHTMEECAAIAGGWAPSSPKTFCSARAMNRPLLCWSCVRKPGFVPPGSRAGWKVPGWLCQRGAADGKADGRARAAGRWAFC